MFVLNLYIIVKKLAGTVRTLRTFRTQRTWREDWEWARNHLDYEWIGAEDNRYAHVKQVRESVVDIDEKWFGMRTRRMLKHLRV